MKKIQKTKRQALSPEKKVLSDASLIRKVIDGSAKMRPSLIGLSSLSQQKKILKIKDYSDPLLDLLEKIPETNKEERKT